MGLQVTYAWVLAVAAAGVVLSYATPVWFAQTYVAEDGFVEWLTFAALLAGALLCWGRAWRLRGTHQGRLVVMLVLIGAAFCFGAGEEISWGQRLLGLNTPEPLKAYNKQGELNLHNLELGGVSINKLIFGKVLAGVIVAHFLILPPLYRRRRRLQAIVDTWGIPVPTWRQTAVYIIAAILVHTVNRVDSALEPLEFVGAWMYLTVLWRPENHAVFTRTAHVSAMHAE